MAHNQRSEQEGERRREEIIEVVERFIAENGFSPTRAEIATAIRISERKTRDHVNRLIEDGRLESGDGPRTLRLPF